MPATRLRPQLASTQTHRQGLQPAPTRADREHHRTAQPKPVQPMDRGPERLRGVWADCSPLPRSRPGSSPAPHSDRPRPTHRRTARPWPSKHLPGWLRAPASRSRRPQLPRQPPPALQRQSPRAHLPPNPNLLLRLRARRAPPLPRKAHLPANPPAAAPKAPPQKDLPPEGPLKALNQRLEPRSNCRRSSTCG
jgi:hypothetical protein